MSKVSNIKTKIDDVFYVRETISSLPSDERFIRINPLYIEGWNELINGTPGHSFFHTSNWARVLNESSYSVI